MRSIEQLIESWNGLAVVSHFDPVTAAWIFIALHDETLGSPVGGTRMRVYDSPAEGLRDAMRLAEGMTHKWAAVGLDSGGGKAVLALSRELDDDERRHLLARYGRVVESLKGGFGTGEDLGTTPNDMAVLAQTTRYVHGVGADGAVRDPGPFTALGVFAGIRAAAAAALDAGSLDGLRVVIQGTGHVGGPLARLCAEAGAQVVVGDTDGERARRVAAEIGAEVVDATRLHQQPCEILVPCAIGATLNATTIPQLSCRIVAGSANNQLATAEDAERLHRRKILYAPDYVINAGGAMAFGLIARGETDEELLQRRVEGIGETLREIFAEARDHDESPLHAARRRVERFLSR